MGDRHTVGLAWAGGSDKNKNECLLCVDPCAEYFIYIISFNPHGSCVSQSLLALFYG